MRNVQRGRAVSIVRFCHTVVGVTSIKQQKCFLQEYKWVKRISIKAINVIKQNPQAVFMSKELLSNRHANAVVKY